MFLKLTVAFLAIISLGTVLSAVAQTSRPDKIRKAVQGIGLQGDITVVREDGGWVYGRVQRIDTGSFTIYDIDQKADVNYSYDQVEKVFKGYGPGGMLQRDRQGRRIPPSRRHVGWIVGGALFGTLLLLVVFGLK
ncbi:MAG: hypothetical protein JO053_13820 [Acidobacteria bacterium]|nr:hypothetical protein [Acidobacteriota bacterium]